jgi:tetratricopeptide (TPR) repeat protein
LAYAGVRFRQGKYRDCIRWARRGAASATATNDRGVLAHAYFLLDHAAAFLGQKHEHTYAERALALFEEIGDHVGQANVLNNWGVTAYYEGRWDDALDFYEKSRAHRERAGDVIGAATALNNAAEILSDQGKAVDAAAMFREARRDFGAHGYALGVAVVTSNLGRAEARLGNAKASLRLLDEARQLFEEMHAAAFLAETAVRRCESLLLDGQIDAVLDESATWLESLKGSAGNDVTIVGLLRVQAQAHLARGAVADAAVVLERAITQAEAADASYELKLCLDIRAGFEWPA